MTGAPRSVGVEGPVADPGAQEFRGGGRLVIWSLMIGVVSLAALALGAAFDRRQAAFSYLMAFVFWHSIAFGGLIHLMIQHAINASWGVVVRRVAEGVASVFPILAVLFLPLAVGVEELYPWTQPPVDLEGEPERLARALEREAYLNLPFFYLRAALYFAIWIVVAWLLERWTLRQAALVAGGEGGEGAGELARRQRLLSALGLPLVAFAVTFAAIDWVMTLEREWLSTIFGVYYFSGAAVAIVALLIVASYLLQRGGYLRGVVTTSHYHALGKLLLVFVVFWAYIAFSQFLLIWIADIPREVEWFVVRSRGSWAIVSVLLVFGHFAIPFFLLLSWRLKRRPGALAAVSAWVIVMHLADIYWLVLPALHRGGARPNWLDLAALLGVGGITVAYGVWRFRGRVLAPIGDPRYTESLEFFTT